MPSSPDRAQPTLSRISVAARSALASPTHIDIANFIGIGPSIRARARLALVIAFLVAAPTLFIGVLRTERVATQAVVLSNLDNFWKDILHARLAAQNLDLSILTYMAEGEFDNAQTILAAVERFREVINRLASHRPADLNVVPKGYIDNLSYRLDTTVEHALQTGGSLAPARLSLITLVQELVRMETWVAAHTTSEKKRASFLFSTVSRDQLILFLVLILAMPLFVGFVPGWIAVPLSRLRQISRKIEMGKLREIAVSGRDEVATLARTLKGFLLRKEDLEQKKSSKIFEIRNVLRSVINRVDEPVFVVDNNVRINYTNEAAALQFGLPVHQMEGKIMSDCMYSPSAQKVLEKSFTGDVSDESIPLTIESSDGREHLLEAKIGVVRNRDGEVSRVVMVLFEKKQSQPEAPAQT